MGRPGACPHSLCPIASRGHGSAVEPRFREAPERDRVRIIMAAHYVQSAI